VLGGVVHTLASRLPLPLAPHVRLDAGGLRNAASPGLFPATTPTLRYLL